MSGYRKIWAAVIAASSFACMVSHASAQTPQQQRDDAMQKLQQSSSDVDKFIQQNDQSAFAGRAPNFKVGDSVEAVFFDGTWHPAIVTEGCAGTAPCYGYSVAQGTVTWFAKAQNVRSHTMTTAEQSETGKSAAELAARAKSGTGIGAQYGVREPTTCKSRTALPTATTAKQYVLCGAEGFDGVENVNILANVTVQVASPRAFNYAQDANNKQIDINAPVYDIRGGYKQYQCGKPQTGSGAYIAAHNCILYDQPEARGSCYRDTFGDWHCSLTGKRLASTGEAGQMAPR